jgi:hypothetical protein
MCGVYPSVFEKNNFFFMFSDYFDVLMLKIIFLKNLKNIILMYF